MSFVKLRFNVTLEDDEKWAVIDSQYGAPAAFGTEVLHGLTEQQAQTFATILNDIHPPRKPRSFNLSDDETPLSLN